jgi:uncharacterized membrane protein (DUF4010 family)
MSLQLGFDLLVAALVGLAVGLEREWSGHATGPDARFAGLRTFALLGTIGGFGGWFFTIQQPVAAACLVGGAILFTIVAYATTMQRAGSTVDGTTEVAAILVIAMGVTAGLGNRTLASAAAAVMLVLLAEKSAFQSALQRVGAAELRATLQFAVLALVVLPLLPTGEYGPYGAFQPRQLWSVVLLFSALSFAGYIARRVVGESRGLGITGLLGGLVSSTAVTISFSRRSRDEPTLAAPLAFGVAAACTVLLLRVLVIATVLRSSLFRELLPLLGVPFVVSATLLIIAFWRQRPTAPVPNIAGASASPANGDVPRVNGMQNPLALWTSIQMAIAFQLVLFIIAWVQATVGNPGILATAALLGLTDMDALTLSMTRLAEDAAQVHVAATAIGIGMIANTVLKLCVALVLGAGPYRVRAAASLLLLGSASGIALWWRW